MAQKHDEEDNSSTNNNQQKTNPSSPTSIAPAKKSQRWMEKLRRDEQTNTELSKQIGLVTDTAALEAIDQKLGQKVEGYSGKDDGSPTSAAAAASPSTTVTNTKNNNNDKGNNNPEPEKTLEEQLSGAKGGPTQARLPKILYFRYFQSHHTFWITVCIISAIIFVAIGCQVFRSGIDLWILEWAKDVSTALKEGRAQHHSNSYWIWTSVAALGFNIFFSICLLGLFLYVNYSSSIHTHNKTINSLFKATLGYLDTTPMGTIINALTRDHHHHPNANSIIISPPHHPLILTIVPSPITIPFTSKISTRRLSTITNIMNQRNQFWHQLPFSPRIWSQITPQLPSSPKAPMSLFQRVYYPGISMVMIMGMVN
jgi:hypothetical protein